MKKKKIALRYRTPLTPLRGDVKVVTLFKENDLNKILKHQKRSRSTINLLFISPWDDHCTTLVDQINTKYCGGEEDAREVVYIVNSYSMPHSFVIFNSSKVPQLVRLEGEKVLTEDFLPVINQFFGLE